MNAPLFKLFGKLDPWLDRILGKESKSARRFTYFAVAATVFLVALLVIYGLLLVIDWFLRLKGYQ